MAKHRQVSDISCSDAGVSLMKIDAYITLRAVQHCQSQGMAVLPVQDSLIVPATDAERTVEIMMAAFKRRFPPARPCEIRIKNPLLQNWEKLWGACVWTNCCLMLCSGFFE
jgi:hypothetical protein